MAYLTIVLDILGKPVALGTAALGFSVNLTIPLWVALIVGIWAFTVFAAGLKKKKRRKRRW